MLSRVSEKSPDFQEKRQLLDKAAGFASGRLMAEPAGEVLRLPARVLKNKHVCGERRQAAKAWAGWSHWATPRAHSVPADWPCSQVRPAPPARARSPSPGLPPVAALTGEGGQEKQQVQPTVSV